MGIKTVDVTGQPFKQAVAFQTATKPANFWEAQAIYSLSRVVPKDADVLVSFMARSADAVTPAKVNVTFKEQGTNKSLFDQQFTLDNKWTKVEMKFKNPQLARANVELNAGWQAQTLEIANFRGEYSGGNTAEIEAAERAEEAKSAAGPRATMTIPRGSYYDKLREEFKAVGNSYLILGSNEDEALDAFSGVNNGKGENLGPIQKFEVQGLPFKRAMRLKVDNEKSTGMWDVHVNANNKAPVYKGEQLLWVFWARGVKAPQKVDDGAGSVIGPLMWQRDPYEHVSWPWPGMDITPEWKRYWVISESNGGTGGAGGVARDYAPHKLDINFNVGHKNQTVELGGIAVMAFKNADVTKLPQQNWDYFGRDPKAAWRAEANKRINQHRKADLRVLVRDAKGKPVPNAQVRIAMKKHAFLFGTATSAKSLADPNNTQYRDVIKKYFNSVGFYNDFKWGAMEDGWASDAPTRKAALEWLKANNKTIRGHVLVWPSFHNSPGRLKELKDKPKELQAEILKHVTNTVTTYKDYVSDWDVTNETEGNSDFMNIIGPEAMIEWYKAARAADPKAKLTFLEPSFGDHGMEGGSFPNKKLPGYKGWVEYLLKNGAPLDVLGSQAHGGAIGQESSNGAYGVWKYYDQLVKTYGKPLQYTELDIAIKNPDDPKQVSWQADRLRDSLIIAFAHPAVTGAMQWAFWENEAWLPTTGLWNKDWTPKPSAQAYIDLVTKTWWTDVQKKADAKGEASTRGFLGDYEITVTANGKTKTVPLVLKKGATTPVVVTLK